VSTPPRTIGVGVIGFGVMGRAHAAAYERAQQAGAPCELRAICTRTPITPAGEAADNLSALAEELPFDPSTIRQYARVEDLLADPTIDALSICTHTDSHIPIARMALESGRHALVEKPVGLRAQPIRRLAAMAERTGLLCMPAMCMRFWPGWPWLREQILTGVFGPVRSATFHRLGTAPSWSRGFYGDPARSGGAMHDLHVHDVDFILWCFGRPVAVTTAGDRDRFTTLYHYAGGPVHVAADGGWTKVAGFPFRMRYLVEFDRAVVDFDLTRDPPLMLTERGSSSAVPLPGTSAYDAEVRHFVEVIARGDSTGHPSLEEAAAVTSVIEAEERSIRSGRRVRLPRSSR